MFSDLDEALGKAMKVFWAQRYDGTNDCGGQLRPDFPVQLRARRAFDALIALGFRGRSGADTRTLLEDAEDTASLILS